MIQTSEALKPTLFSDWRDVGAWPWMNFSPEEIACKHCSALLLDPFALNKLQAVRWLLDIPLPVTSGYRCPGHNEKVSDTGRDGPHTTGRAFDIKVSHAHANALLELAYCIGIPGIGQRQHGKLDKRLVHLDWCQSGILIVRPASWSYA